MSRQTFYYLNVSKNPEILITIYILTLQKPNVGCKNYEGSGIRGCVSQDKSFRMSQAISAAADSNNSRPAATIMSVIEKLFMTVVKGTELRNAIMDS